MRLFDLRIFLQRPFKLSNRPVVKARHQKGMAKIEMKLRGVTQSKHHLVEDHTGAVHVLHFEIGKGEGVANAKRGITTHSFGTVSERFLPTFPLPLSNQPPPLNLPPPTPSIPPP